MLYTLFIFNINHSLLYDIYCDHYLVSSIQSIVNHHYHFLQCSSYILIPLFSTIKIYVVAIDVIHSFGFYSFGIKIDAIPGRFNIAQSLQSVFKSEHKGFCFELCGTEHSAMLLRAITLILIHN